MTPGLKLTTILYAGGLAVVSAAMLSLLPALRATRARVQSHLANLGAGGATLRFGRVWTGAMIAQVALTAIGIPAAMESASQAMRNAEHPRGSFQVESISPLASMWTGRSTRRPRRRSRSGGRGRSRRSSGASRRNPASSRSRSPTARRGQLPRARVAEVESSPGAGRRTTIGFGQSAVGPGFFEAFDRPIVAGRAFHGGDRSPAARTVIVNEAFAREFSRDAGSGSPIGARLRYSASSRRASARRGSGGAVVRDRRRRARLRPGPRRRGRRAAVCVSRGVGGNGVSARDECARARQSGHARRASAGHCGRCRCRIVRPGGAAAGRMGPAAGYDADRARPERRRG